jgi:hypothetical protein
VVALYKESGVNASTAFEEAELAAKARHESLAEEVAARLRLAYLLTDLVPAAASARTAADLTEALRSSKLVGRKN